MPDVSFLTTLDKALRVRVWNKFKDAMGITDMNNDSAIYSKAIAFRHISEKRGKVMV